jgi:drug/metabolite transporter (DMT)-like permease
MYNPPPVSFAHPSFAGGAMSAVPARPSDAPPRALVYAAFASIYLIWGSTYLGIRFAIETLPPFLMAGTRFILAGGVLYAVMRLSGEPRPARRQWGWAALTGGLMIVGGNGGVTWAEQLVPSGLTAVLVATIPLWVVLIEWIRPRGARPGGPVLAGVGLGLLGIALLVGPQELAGGGRVNPLGAGILFSAALSWATGTVISHGPARPDSPLVGTSIQMLSGGVLLWLLGSGAGEWAQVNPGGVSARSLLALAYLTVFGSLIAFTAYTWLIRVAGPSRASTYAYVNPVVAVMLGWALAGEELTIRTLVAAAIIVGGVVLVTTYRGRSQA